MNNSIAIYNFKGGVGKTTTALNLGISWARSFKVLLIDFDPQCNLTNSIAVSRSRDSAYTAVKHLIHGHSLDFDPLYITPYLHLIPGDFRLTEFESNSQFISFGADIIAEMLNKYRKQYDFILMDCPTNFGVLVRAILSSGENIVVPAIADNFSITGIQQLMTYLAATNNHDLNILGVYFNMYTDQLKLSHERYEEAKRMFGQAILSSTVRRSIKVGEATEIGQSVCDYSPENSAAQDFTDLSDELLARFNTTAISKDHIIPELLEQVRA